jgi:hypothetical protein
MVHHLLRHCVWPTDLLHFNRNGYPEAWGKKTLWSIRNCVTSHKNRTINNSVDRTGNHTTVNPAVCLNLPIQLSIILLTNCQLYSDCNCPHYCFVIKFFAWTFSVPKLVFSFKKAAYVIYNHINKLCSNSQCGHWLWRTILYIKTNYTLNICWSLLWWLFMLLKML